MPARGREHCRFSGMTLRNDRLLTAASKGALAGTIATVPMTAAMNAVHRLLPGHQRYELPPQALSSEVSRRAGASPPTRERVRRAGWLGPHLAFGCAAGAFLAASAPRHRPTVSRGIAFGLGVWAVSYLGWIPALRLPHAAQREPASRNAMMVAAHVVWGATTAALLKRG
jgi:hypothetical protein